MYGVIPCSQLISGLQKSNLPINTEVHIPPSVVPPAAPRCGPEGSLKLRASVSEININIMAISNAVDGAINGETVNEPHQTFDTILVLDFG